MKEETCSKRGHLLRYNFNILPNKAICKRCKQKFILNLNDLYWEEVDQFKNESRTDEELLKCWFK